MENGQLTMNNKFITKKELAQRWGIDKKTLARRLHGDEDCMKELAKTGYNRSQKQFTPKQVEIVLKFFE